MHSAIQDFVFAWPSYWLGVPAMSKRPRGSSVKRGRSSRRSRPVRPASQFRVEAERFADARILRYRVPGFEALDSRTKRLLYYLYEAALSGHEIMYDQKYRYNLAIKRTLEEIVKHYPGDRGDAEFQALQTYLKRIWLSNGIHHHYANDKFEPGFTAEAFERFVEATPRNLPGARRAIARRAASRSSRP